MPKPQKRLPPARPVTRPAPVNGWNARDAYPNMGALDAVVLTNYFPSPTDVSLRYGHSQFATGMTGQIETLMAWSGAASNKLFAAAGSRIYNITAGGVIGAADVSSLTNGRWQYVNNTTAAGNYIQAVNGADKMRVYNGTAWFADGDGSPYDVTGIDTATLIGIFLSHNRVWFIPTATLKAWYLPAGAIGGAASALDLSSFAQRGGYLMAGGTWTMDAGYGMDDMTVFVTSNGEVIVYRGTDPASASTWSLVGVYWIGSPIGRRCLQKIGGDLAIICQDGVVPMAAALQSSRVNPKSAFSNKIQNAISGAVSSYGSTYGWQLMPFPKENMLILNVPVAVGSQQQYVMSTIKRANGDWAWCNFTGWNANCWELYADNIYFGGNTFVGKAWDTNADNGSAIPGFILQSFSDFGAGGRLKRATSMRPYLLTNGSPQIFAGMNWEFDQSDPSSALSFTPTSYGVWDTGRWDSAVWGADVSPSFALQGATGSGHYGAPVFKSSSSGIQVRLASTDIYLVGGGYI